MVRRKFIGCIVGILLLNTLAIFVTSTDTRGAVLEVPAQYPTIQDAIDAAVDGDTVLVSPGIYVENIDFLGKAIIVKSTDGPEVTIIDGNQDDSVVMFCNGEESDSILDGFTITNGLGADGGGGIYIEDSSPTIINNIIYGNSGEWGSGVLCSESSSVFTNNIIVKNIDEAGMGGGMYFEYSSPIITNNVIAFNEADSGGGIYCIDSVVTVVNTILWNNNARDGAEVWIGYETTPSVFDISYSDVKEGQVSIYLDPDCTLNWGDGMIDADPLFKDPENNNFYLIAESPCIDVGDNGAPMILEKDIEGDRRVVDSNGDSIVVIDMGADEFLTLKADNHIISGYTGGTVNFTLNAGVNNAGRIYILLGGYTGTEPGTPLPGGYVTLPLNWDHLTDRICGSLNTYTFTDFLGVLDENGTATAQLNVVGPLGCGFTGPLYFAYALNNPWNFVSNYVVVEIV